MKAVLPIFLLLFLSACNKDKIEDDKAILTRHSWRVLESIIDPPYYDPQTGVMLYSLNLPCESVSQHTFTLDEQLIIAINDSQCNPDNSPAEILNYTLYRKNKKLFITLFDQEIEVSQLKQGEMEFKMFVDLSGTKSHIVFRRFRPF